MSLDALAAAWWSWIAPLSVQLVPLGVALALVDRLLARRVRAEWRAAVWALVFARVVVPPGVRSALSPAALLPDGFARAWSGAPLATSGTEQPLGALFLVWLAVACGLVLGALVRARRSAAGELPAPEDVLRAARRLASALGLRRVPPLLASADLESACVVGVLRPRVLLPARLLAPGNEAERDHVLAHELAHVRRADPLRGLALLVLHAALWFHPVTWLARRKLDLLREQVCDLEAARVTGSAGAYRRTLLALAARAHGLAPQPGLGFLSGSRVLARLEGLERVAGSAPAQLHCWLLTALLAGACLPLAPGESRSSGAFAGDSLTDLPGCLQARYLVMRELAQHAPTD